MRCRHCGQPAERGTDVELGVPLCSDCADMAVFNGTCPRCGKRADSRGCKEA